MAKALYFAIDPGPVASGVVIYEKPPGETGRVVESWKAMSLVNIREKLQWYSANRARWRGSFSFTVLVERTTAGPPSSSVVLTTEVVGRILEMCELLDLKIEWYYRRDVLQNLCCTGTGNKDSKVRRTCIDLHGAERRIAIGTKDSRGPLYGVSSHAWQALGLVMAHLYETDPRRLEHRRLLLAKLEDGQHPDIPRKPRKFPRLKR